MLHPPDNVKSMNFFTENIEFPIVIYAKNEWEEKQIEYLKVQQHTTESLCDWCLLHSIHYQITYPLHRMDLVRNPIRYIKYLKLKNKITR